MWRIVSGYFENIRQAGSYEPVRQLEKKIAEVRDAEGANWLAAMMTRVRRSYLAHLGKPRTVSEAIKKQNDAKSREVKRILNSNDLFDLLQESLETDLKRWIEGEGAYDLIVVETGTAPTRDYEKLVQKTLKTQIENMFYRRDFQFFGVDRESQLLDDKRTDFLVRHGFAGPVVLEVKLTSNSDMKGRKIEASRSFQSMQRYMDGYGAAHGIVLLINNTGAKNVPAIKTAFQKIPNVTVQVFDCYLNAGIASKAVNRGQRRQPTRRNSAKRGTKSRQSKTLNNASGRKGVSR
jgi:hypothetical protein